MIKTTNDITCNKSANKQKHTYTTIQLLGGPPTKNNINKITQQKQQETTHKLKQTIKQSTRTKKTAGGPQEPHRGRREVHEEPRGQARTTEDSTSIKVNKSTH